MMPVRKWDRAVRTTKQSENSVDAVVILAILRYDKSGPSKDEIVCVKQFRPPVDGLMPTKILVLLLNVNSK